MPAGWPESRYMDRCISSWHHINWYPHHSHSGKYQCLKTQITVFFLNFGLFCREMLLGKYPDSALAYRFADVPVLLVVVHCGNYSINCY